MSLLLFSRFYLPIIALATLLGCAPDYSPNTYSGNAVQQANKVERAVVIGFRQVKISANGTIGAVTGGAAGGVLGSQVDASGIDSALGTVGGTLVGGIVGTTIEHATADTTGWEYIVRKPDGDLLSVAQREPTPIPLGEKVLVITGNQARIVPDYSTALDPPPASATDKDKAAKEKPAPTATPVAASEATNAVPPKSGEQAAPLPDPIAAAPSAPAVAAPAEPPPGARGGPSD